MPTHGFDDGSYSRWVTIGPQGNRYKLDGGFPQQYDTVHHRHERSELTDGKYQLAYLQMQNRSGATRTVGAGVRLASSAWVAGSFNWSTNTFNDDTTDAQNTTDNDFSMELTGANAASSGFMIGCRHTFNCIAVNVTTASTGGTPIRGLRYSTAAASPANWRVMPIADAFVAPTSSAQWEVGEQLIWWAKPTDWAQSVSNADHAVGASAGYYWMQVLSTTAAASSAASAGSLSIADLPFTIEGLGDNVIYEPQMNGMYIPLNPAGDAFVTAWSAASVGNTVTALLRARG